MKKSVLILTAAALCLALSCTVVAFAVDDSQVLIAKDYFDQVISTLATKEYVDETMATKDYVDETMATKDYVDETMATKSYVDETMITKSYADEKLATKSYVDEKVSSSVVTSSAVSGSGEYIVLELGEGDVITFGASTELILRGGTAKTVIPTTAGGGFSDLTAGADIGDAKSISANHLLLVPRDDGRALQITSSIAYLMVKGSYTIQ